MGACAFPVADYIKPFDVLCLPSPPGLQEQLDLRQRLQAISFVTPWECVSMGLKGVGEGGRSSGWPMLWRPWGIVCSVPPLLPPVCGIFYLHLHPSFVMVQQYSRKLQCRSNCALDLCSKPGLGTYNAFLQLVVVRSRCLACQRYPRVWSSSSSSFSSSSSNGSCMPQPCSVTI